MKPVEPWKHGYRNQTRGGRGGGKDTGAARIKPYGSGWTGRSWTTPRVVPSSGKGDAKNATTKGGHGISKLLSKTQALLRWGALSKVSRKMSILIFVRPFRAVDVSIFRIIFSLIATGE